MKHPSPFRHLAAILMLPFVVTVIVPFLLVKGQPIDLWWGGWRGGWWLTPRQMIDTVRQDGGVPQRLGTPASRWHSASTHVLQRDAISPILGTPG